MHALSNRSIGTFRIPYDLWKLQCSTLVVLEIPDGLVHQIAYRSWLLYGRQTISTSPCHKSTPTDRDYYHFNGMTVTEKNILSHWKTEIECYSCYCGLVATILEGK